ncbi:MAG: MFS transporter, partial [Actinomycetota bacterium]|nr:MFS transporter [Actinomycetota bacterium]
AMALAGRGVQTELFQNSVVAMDGPLLFLGDVFAVPAWVPFANVFSIGDICIVLGTVAAIHGLAGSRFPLARPAGRRSLLADRAFVRLWGANAVSQVGDWVYMIAVAATVAERTGSAAHLAGLVMAQSGAAAIVGLFGGPWIDRLPRRKLMVAADLVRAAAVATLLLPGDTPLVQFYVVAVGLGAMGSVFQPALQASLPNLVDKDRLVSANAVMTGTFHAAIMIGPLLGGVMVAELGLALTIAINALSFVVSAALLLTIKIPSPSATSGTTSAIEELKDGLRYVAVSPLVRSVFLVIGLVMVGAAIKAPLEPLFVLRTLGLEPRALGLLGASWGLGMLIGTLMAPAVARRIRRELALTVGIAAVGIAILCAAMASSVWVIAVLWVGAGIGNAVGTICYETLLQERTPDRFRGRVIAASESVLEASFLLGAACAGFVAHAAGVRGAFAVAGAVFLIAAAGSLVALRPRRRATSNERRVNSAAPTRRSGSTSVLAPRPPAFRPTGRATRRVVYVAAAILPVLLIWALTAGRSRRGVR